MSQRAREEDGEHQQVEIRMAGAACQQVRSSGDVSPIKGEPGLRFSFFFLRGGVCTLLLPKAP